MLTDREMANVLTNAFVITEWHDFDSSKEMAQPYPFEASSHQAIFYEYDRETQSDLQLLIVHTVETDNTQDDPGELDRYTMYYIGHYRSSG